MTNDDRISVLSLAKEVPVLVEDPDTGKKKNFGGLGYDKKGSKGPYGADVSDLLERGNGTYRWDMDCPRNGLEQFDNIHQAMAADAYAPGGRQKDRMLTGDDRENDIRSGVKTLAKWLDEVWGVTLYRCTSPDRRKNQVVVITIHPDLIVDPATGATAMEYQRQRDEKAVDGQIRAALRRQARIEGARIRETFRLKVDEMIDTFEVENPRGPRLEAPVEE
jgi:hypothetical protein